MKREDVKVGQRVQISDATWERVNSPIFTASTLQLSREGIVVNVEGSRSKFSRMKVTVRHDTGQDFGNGDGLRTDWPWSASDVEDLLQRGSVSDLASEEEGRLRLAIQEVP